MPPEEDKMISHLNHKLPPFTSEQIAVPDRLNNEIELTADAFEDAFETWREFQACEIGCARW